MTPSHSPASTQERPFTVTSLTERLKAALEGGFSRIYIEGEISGWRPAASGHVYFTLKDDASQVSAVMFRSAFERCRARESLRDGAKVLLYASLSVYGPRGQYQLVVMAAKPVGEGDLMQRYLELKARLEREGLFDPSRKRRLPFLPRRIGIVTSPSGAVVHDICRVLMRRFPAIEIRIFPALVQGSAAPAAVIAGLGYFASQESWRADAVIVARGGGSFEDLFCFNDEALVRAVAASPVPVISAVGHETDFTLCDFAADLRAGTPSMAAEMAVPVLADLSARIASASSSLAASLRGKYEWFAQRVDGLSDSLDASLRSYEVDARRRVEVLCAKLELLSPFSVLDRGYSLTTDGAGRVVRSPDDVREGDVVSTRLQSGSIVSRVEARHCDVVRRAQ